MRLPIWRKLWCIQRTNASGEAPLAFSLKVDGVDLKTSIVAGGKKNCVPIRRKGWIEGSCLMVRQLFAPAAIRVHQADLVDLLTKQANTIFPEGGLILPY